MCELALSSLVERLNTFTRNLINFAHSRNLFEGKSPLAAAAAAVYIATRGLTLQDPPTLQRYFDAS